LPFAPFDDIETIIEDITQYKDVYLAGVTETSETYDAVQVPRSSERRKLVACTGRIANGAEFIDAV
jgi:hypothetical protein